MGKPKTEQMAGGKGAKEVKGAKNPSVTPLAPLPPGSFAGYFLPYYLREQTKNAN